MLLEHCIQVKMKIYYTIYIPQAREDQGTLNNVNY